MQIVLANRQVNLLLGDGQIESHAPLDQGHKLIDKAVVEGVNRDIGGMINIAPIQRLHHIVKNWSKVLRHEVDPIRAPMTNILRLKGNLAKVIHNVKAAHDLVLAATNMPTK